MRTETQKSLVRHEIFEVMHYCRVMLHALQNELDTTFTENLEELELTVALVRKVYEDSSK
jgi:hypothetical protein